VTDSSEEARSMGVWYQRSPLVTGRLFEARAYRNDDHPDGTVIDVGPDDPHGPRGDLVGTVGFDDNRRTRVILTEPGFSGAPALWFVGVPSEAMGRPQMSLAAFATSHLPDGTVITNATFFSMPVRTDEQVGAIRWWADTGMVDQIFVHEPHRNSYVGLKLAATADGIHHHHGWPGAIHVGGNRTDLGQKAVEARANPHRSGPRTQRSVLRKE